MTNPELNISKDTFTDESLNLRYPKFLVGPILITPEQASQTELTGEIDDPTAKFIADLIYKDLQILTQDNSDLILVGMQEVDEALSDDNDFVGLSYDDDLYDNDEFDDQAFNDYLAKLHNHKTKTIKDRERGSEYTVEGAVLEEVSNHGSHHFDLIRTIQNNVSPDLSSTELLVVDSSKLRSSKTNPVLQNPDHDSLFVSFGFNDAEELIDAIVCSFDISIVPLDVDHPNFKELAKNEQNIINDRLNELADKIKRYNDIISMHNPGSVKRIAAKSMMSFIEDEKQRLNQELASLQKQGEA